MGTSLLAAILLVLGGSVASPARGEGRSAIRSVRAEYAAVNRRLRRCAPVERALFDRSTEGAAVTGYFDGPALRKIEAVYYGCSGKETDELYFRNGRLIFVLRTHSWYDRPLGQVVRTEQSRLYFQHGRLIQWLGPGSRRLPVDGGAARWQEHRHLHDARELTMLIRSR